MPTAARRVHDQLGLAYDYAADGSGGPAFPASVGWGAAWQAGRIGATEILFPRVEIAES
jgi:hypothetical protein